MRVAGGHIADVLGLQEEAETVPRPTAVRQRRSQRRGGGRVGHRIVVNQFESVAERELDGTAADRLCERYVFRPIGLLRHHRRHSHQPEKSERHDRRHPRGTSRHG